MSLVFQNFALFPHMNVAENVCVRTEMEAPRPRREGKESLRGVGDGRPVGAAAPPAPRAQLGPATKGGAGPGSRPAPRDPAARRTPLRPRRRPAGSPPPRNPPATKRAWDHHDPRHPRPGGGARHSRQGRDHEPGRPRPGGSTVAGLRYPGLGLCRPLCRAGERDRGHIDWVIRPAGAARRRPTSVDSLRFSPGQTSPRPDPPRSGASRRRRDKPAHGRPDVSATLVDVTFTGQSCTLHLRAGNQQLIASAPGVETPRFRRALGDALKLFVPFTALRWVW